MEPRPRAGCLRFRAATARERRWPDFGAATESGRAFPSRDRKGAEVARVLEPRPRAGCLRFRAATARERRWLDFGAATESGLLAFPSRDRKGAEVARFWSRDQGSGVDSGQSAAC